MMNRGLPWLWSLSLVSHLYSCSNHSSLGFCHERSELKTSLHESLHGFHLSERCKTAYHFTVFEDGQALLFGFFCPFMTIMHVIDFKIQSDYIWLSKKPFWHKWDFFFPWISAIGLAWLGSVGFQITHLSILPSWQLFIPFSLSEGSAV